jgi:hypothetical protein
MKTTLVIDDQVMHRLKQEAARQGRTISEMVESALRRLLEPEPARGPLAELPSFKGGREIVDVADREALSRAMDED